MGFRAILASTLLGALVILACCGAAAQTCSPLMQSPGQGALLGQDGGDRVARFENIAIILDASNSMNEAFEVEPKIVEAKAAIVELLDILPDGLTIRLSVYGHRVPQEDTEGSCQDIERLFGPAELDSMAREEMLGKLDTVVARGLTPLAAALERAGTDLMSLGAAGLIIVLTDGEETCGGELGPIAATFADAAIPVVLCVIGLDLEPDARERLTQVAEQTGGQYVRARAAGGIANALLEVLMMAQEADVLGVPPEYACLGITNIIVGTEGKDTLIGTAGNDLIYGLGGNDLLIGLEGNDVLLGGEGSDVLEGGDGCDVLLGDGGNDVLFGGGGDDLLCGGVGNDSVEGEAGNDRLNGGLGDDYLLGGSGQNLLDGGGGNDLLLEGQPGAVLCAPCCVPCPPAPCPPTCPVPPAPCPPQCPVPVDPCAPTCTPPPADMCDTKSVDEGSCIQLHGTVTDHDCNVVTVLWQADKGTFDDPTSLDPVYYAPMTPYCEGEDVCITLVATDSCGAVGRDAFWLHINNVNHAPLADAGEDLAVNEGATVRLTCSASDPDGDAVSVYWTSECGQGTFDDPTQLHPCYLAPMTSRCEGQPIVLTMTVTDACGASTCDTLVVYVRNVNCPPTADAGEDVCVDEGATVLLTCGAMDPDGDALSYYWTAECGRGVFNDPTLLHPTYTAPYTDSCSGETVTVTLTVTDACGAISTDSIVIYVRDVNHPPVVELGPGFCLDECAAVGMMPVVSDPECAPLSYQLTATAGSFDDPCAANPTYYAPGIDVCEGIDVTISLRVTDPCGLYASDSMSIHINNINNPPLVIADP